MFLNGASGNLNGNSSEVDITTTGAVDINSGAFTVDGSVTIKGTGASKYGDDTATLTLMVLEQFLKQV